MPRHKSYDVNSAEGESTPLARSYNAKCVLALIGFFLCGALILAVCFMISLPRTGLHSGNVTESRNGEDRVEGTGKLTGENGKDIPPNTDQAGITPTTMPTVKQHVTPETILDTDDAEKVPGSNTNGSNTSRQPYEKQSLATNGSIDDQSAASTTPVPTTNGPVDGQSAASTTPVPTTNGPVDGQSAASTTPVPTTNGPVDGQSAASTTPVPTTNGPVDGQSAASTTPVPTTNGPVDGQSAASTTPVPTTNEPVDGQSAASTTPVPTTNGPVDGQSAASTTPVPTTNGPVDGQSAASTTPVPTTNGPVDGQSAASTTPVPTTNGPVDGQSAASTTPVPTTNGPVDGQSAASTTPVPTTNGPVDGQSAASTTPVPTTNGPVDGQSAASTTPVPTTNGPVDGQSAASTTPVPTTNGPVDGQSAASTTPVPTTNGPVDGQSAASTTPVPTTNGPVDGQSAASTTPVPTTNEPVDGQSAASTTPVPTTNGPVDGQSAASTTPVPTTNGPVDGQSAASTTPVPTTNGPVDGQSAASTTPVPTTNGPVDGQSAASTTPVPTTNGPVDGQSAASTTPVPTTNGPVDGQSAASTTPVPTTNGPVDGQSAASTTPVPTTNGPVDGQSAASTTPVPTTNGPVDGQSAASTTPVPTTNGPVDGQSAASTTPVPTTNGPVDGQSAASTTPVPTTNGPVDGQSAASTTPVPTTNGPVDGQSAASTTPVPTTNGPVDGQSAASTTPVPTTNGPVDGQSAASTTPVPTTNGPVDGQSAASTTPVPTTNGPVDGQSAASTTPVPTTNGPVDGQSAASTTPVPTTNGPVDGQSAASTTPVPTTNGPVDGQSAASTTPVPTTNGPVDGQSAASTTPVPTTNGPFDQSSASTASLSNRRGISDSTKKIPSVIATKPTKSMTSQGTQTAELDKQRVNLGSKIASRMLYYMNHLTDECADFYEYACGEFEANNVIPENDLAKLATQRIFDQYKKSDEPPVYNTQFFGYYNSCVDAYTDNSNASYQERIELAKTAIEEVGTFYSDAEWNDRYFDLTIMLSKLLQRGSAPLFDVTLDVAVDPQESCDDKKSKPKFTLKLGPPLIKKSVHVDEKEDKCYRDRSSKILEKSVDLKSLYDQHEKCTNKMKDFLDSIEDVLEKLGVPGNIKTYTKFDIERLSSTVLPQEYQTKKIINEAYVTRKYEVMQIAELQSKTVPELFLNWTLLLEKLTNSAVVSQQSLQVYFSPNITKGLNNLYRERKEVAGLNQRALHNALLGLYAYKVYQELVAPQRDVENYCKRMATGFMGTHASKLYMSSFSSDDLDEMEETAMKTFGELKSALESSVKKATWLKNSDDAMIIEKIRDLEIVFPDKSYYQDNSELDPENSKIQVKLSGNFFKDSMMLLTHNRRLMYEMLGKDPNESAQIWTHFALPYQTSGSAVYELNKVIMPYAAIYWPQVLEANKISSRHLVLATLGTRIAHLIADHFGPTGIRYFNGMRSEEPAVFCNNLTATEEYQSYLDRYDGFIETDKAVGSMELPNMQKVSYEISILSRNQRLSDITGLQLAYDAMSALPPDSKQLMPWLNGRDNNAATQFLVAYAQMHCTKVPLSSTFVTLFEDEHLPSRLRIALVASGSSIFGRTWNCPLGSPIRLSGDPSYAFPRAVN